MSDKRSDRSWSRAMNSGDWRDEKASFDRDDGYSLNGIGEEGVGSTNEVEQPNDERSAGANRMREREPVELGSRLGWTRRENAKHTAIFPSRKSKTEGISFQHWHGSIADQVDDLFPSSAKRCNRSCCFNCSINVCNRCAPSRNSFT